MKKEHQEIIDLVSKYLKENPDQRFGQALFNLGINKFVNNEQLGTEGYKIRYT